VATKKEHRKNAKRRALRLRHSVMHYAETAAKRDSMRAARRYYGQGQGLDG